MTNDKIKIMIIEDEEFDVKRIVKTLNPYRENIEIIEIVSNGKDAIKCMKKVNDIDVIIMDYQISGGIIGEQLISEFKLIDPTTQVVVITKMTLNQTDVYFANQLLNAGAYWFGTKYPADIEEYIYQPTDFILTIRNANEKRTLEKKNYQSQVKLEKNIQNILSKRPLIGKSKVIKSLRSNIQKCAESDANVLITGESGTGKELIAMNLHYKSDRRHEPFVTVNCAAIPNDLIESELFGFVKGSFTGAKEGKKGLFEQAHQGSIFLDEICEVPLALQAKLLRVLETGELDKIGRKNKYEVDVRVISATNQDINSMVKENTFREDLYYRLNILQINSIPIRENAEDIPELINYHLNYISQDRSIIPPIISKSAMRIFKNFNWPGNVRQIKNVAERILIQKVKEFDSSLVNMVLGIQKGNIIIQDVVSTFDPDKIIPLKDVEHMLRKKYVLMVREKSSSDADAARKLGVAPPNYHRMCKELGLKD